MSLNLDRDESILGQMTLNLEVSLHSKFTDYLFISRFNSNDNSKPCIVKKFFHVVGIDTAVKWLVRE